jgi:hypothetical protein
MSEDVIVASHAWSAEALFTKAALYAERMGEQPPDDWQFGFWSALSLELLCRAALANISPVLLADNKEWHNLLHALRLEQTAKKFTPTSISTKEVIARLSELVPTFTKELAGFCSQHAERRNAELHSGELAFTAIGTASWLPLYYATVQALLVAMGKELKDFVADAAGAQAMIDSREDAAAKAVQQDISAHAKVWSNKNDEEREAALAQATAWATRQTGHRAKCPSCGSPALVQGTPSGAVATTIADDDVVQRQAVLPSMFECIACGLRISGLSKLVAAGLGDAFTEKSTYTAAEFFGLYTEDELAEARQEGPEYEDDFNEY